MTDQKWPIFLNLIAALLGAWGQFFYKNGAQKSHGLSLAVGVLLFIGVMGLFVLAYKMGGRISVVYPFYATTFIWAALIGIFIEKEPWSNWYILGFGSLLFGLIIISQQVKG